MPFGFFLFKAKKKSAKVQEWLKLQSFCDDALTYLIEKEIFENGIQDLSYKIPRLRNDAYFEKVELEKVKETVAASFEYHPRRVAQASAKFGSEQTMPGKNGSVTATSVKPEPFTAFKAASSPVVVAPPSATDLSLIDTACYDD